MNLLLDTHTLLWLMEGNPKLSSTASALMTDPANQRHLSMTSIWELAIKVGLKKLRLNVPLAQFLSAAINGYRLQVLPITIDDCVSYEALPIPNPNHRDPYDRMIVIHALRHSLSIVSVDDKLDGYGATRLW